jgi:BirA family biotin operon repressor/biotin-[acetyl-CoA-carboxylase] ligase
MPMPPFDLESAFARVDARRGAFGRRFIYLAETESTNDVAARLAWHGGEEGALVVAGGQTKGRGRLGRSWHSPPGAGLYFSVVLRPGDAEAADVVRLLTLVGGVAAAEGIRAATGLPVELKWPNDVVIARPWRKLAGLLAEASTVAGRIEHVILGVGINLGRAAYPLELADRATSLEVELGRPVDAAIVLAETVAALAERYADLRAGRSAQLLERWRALAPSLAGSPVEWESRAGPRAGTAVGLDGDGALVVHGPEGTERVVAGEVVWGTPCS